MMKPKSARQRNPRCDLDGATVIEPRKRTAHQFADQYAQLRKAKGNHRACPRNHERCHIRTMLVHNCHADGMVSGAAHTTAHTVRPALRSSRLCSGHIHRVQHFLMCLLGSGTGVWMTALIIPNPTYGAAR